MQVNPFFIILFLVGIVLFFSSILMNLKPPKNINRIYGYRTKRSMKNQEVWDYAQLYSSGQMRLWSLVLIAGSFLGFYLTLNEVFQSILACLISISVCFVPVYFTEKELKNKFKD